MLGNDENVVNFYNQKGLHIYAENDGRDSFDGRYGFLTYNKTNSKKDTSMKDWIIAVGLHPAIICGKEWVATQMLLQKGKDKGYRAAGIYKKQTTIVSGLIKCKICGSNMRPRNMSKVRLDGSVNYRYCCNLKEKSKGEKCNSLNVAGEELDNRIIDIIKNIDVPNILIYNELKEMTMSFQKEENSELEYLENEYKNKQNEIDKLVEKIKYIDIELIDIINESLQKLKYEKENLLAKISNLENKKLNLPTLSNITKSEITDNDILQIIENSYNVFNTFDLKTKRNVVGLFIENILGCGEDIEINFRDMEIEKNKKSIYTYLYRNK